ncbi:MAG: YgiQ family radical SAM protein [Candidatus Woesearchaeota archaeon]
MEYDIIFVVGERYFDHPLCGTAILKRLLEKEGFSVGLIEMPQNDTDIAKLGKPRLFFGVSSGSIDSMVRNYTPLKKRRDEDKNLDYNEKVPDRAVIVYCNWIKKHYKDSVIVIGGTEATLRRFTHYDYWDNKLRRSILLDSRANILVFGMAEKQTVEIAKRLKQGKGLEGIEGTCGLGKQMPAGFIELASHEEVLNSKEKFCDMQNLLTNRKSLAQKVGPSYVLQYKSPKYSSKDLDEYYGMQFLRTTPKELRGFQFSIVTHRGCVGNCNFCSLKLTQGDRIISRSEESILKEIKGLTKLAFFKGNVDDFTGPSADMYGMDCSGCQEGECLNCNRLDKSNERLINLLRKARQIPGIKKVNLKSGIRFDLASAELVKELAEHHIYDFLRIAPEHVNKEVLSLMNKEKGDLDKFIKEFKKDASTKKLSFYFMTAHPGSTIKEARELAEKMCFLENSESVQVFTPTPMTVSTCMYYAGMEPKTKKKIHVPYTYSEKKEQKRVLMKNYSKTF